MQVLRLWEQHHKVLRPQRRREFLRRPEVLRLSRMPEYAVAEAIAQEQKLVRILEVAELRASRGPDKPDDPDEPPASDRSPRSPKPTPNPTAAARRRTQDLDEEDMRRASRPPQRSSIDKAKVADELRENPTAAELALGNKLSERPENWFAQVVIRGFIVDFYCPQALLVVEVDGSSHDNQQAWDTMRDEALAELGIKTIRFANDRVHEDLLGVVEMIRKVFGRRQSEAFNKRLLEHEWNMFRFGEPEKPAEKQKSKKSQEQRGPFQKFQWYCFECPGYFASLNRSRGKCPKNPRHRVARMCRICRLRDPGPDLDCSRCAEARDVALRQAGLGAKGPDSFSLKQGKRGKRAGGAGR